MFRVITALELLFRADICTGKMYVIPDQDSNLRSQCSTGITLDAQQDLYITSPASYKEHAQSSLTNTCISEHAVFLHVNFNITIPSSGVTRFLTTGVSDHKGRP